MKKANLKTGMLVVTRANKTLWVVKGRKGDDAFIELKGKILQHISSYDENFNNKNNKMHDIMEIYSSSYDSIDMFDTVGSSIWRRIEDTELTIADIEKALNISNLKIIK